MLRKFSMLVLFLGLAVASCQNAVPYALNHQLEPIDHNAIAVIDGDTITLTIHNTSNARGCLQESEFQNSNGPLNLMMFQIFSDARPWTYVGVEPTYVGVTFVAEVVPGGQLSRTYRWRGSYSQDSAGTASEPNNARWLGSLYAC